MSRRRKLPHCFYCNDLTQGGLSRIDSETRVCTSCAWIEATDPQRAVDRWVSLGGDRALALSFAERCNGRSVSRLVPVVVGGAV